MAEFLTTTKTTAAIEDIIRHADEWILLISPYLKFDENFRRRIESKRGLGKVTVIYGKTDLQSKEDSWLMSQSWIETRFCKTLHAKCYLNEKEAVLTSMNLHKYSQENNHEMGILVTREEDKGLYDEILGEALEISRDSEVVTGAAKGIRGVLASVVRSATKETARKAQSNTESSNKGFCIRCREPLLANPARPFCDIHFKSWNKFKNDKFEEKHCHLCGKSGKTSRAKPVCRSCYQKRKEFVEAALA